MTPLVPAFVLLARASSKLGCDYTTVIFLGAILAIALAVYAFKCGCQSSESNARDAAKRELMGRENAVAKREKDAARREGEVTAAEAKIAHGIKDLDEKLKEVNRLNEQAEQREKDGYANGIRKKEEALRKILHDVQTAHPGNRYIARVISEAEAVLIDQSIDDALGWRAPVTAERMERSFNQSRRKDRFEARFYKYQTELYESLVPKLIEYADDISDAESDSMKTEESDWLSEDEYARLSDAERSQLALDRYVKSPRKSKWQIGRDYELYIGHVYRNENWEVEHKGIQDGLNDLGRDLICRKGNRVHIVQCKCWSRETVIHEKHIAQLYGTTVAYRIEHNVFHPNALNKQEVIPVFVTSTDLSDQAKLFARTLGVRLVLNKELGNYPRIKCHIGRDKEKIFHLPFDQQYDTTVITEADGDCYAFTVQEAMGKGFRRAMRHYFDV